MSKVQTMGASSCATIAIAGFKAQDRELEDAYIADNTSFTEPEDGMTIDQFYSKVIYPTVQDLGRTGEYPFTKMMEDLETSSLKTKFVICALPAFQLTDGYWRAKLEKWGFKELTKTKNTIGSINTIFTRNPNEVK